VLDKLKKLIMGLQIFLFLSSRPIKKEVKKFGTSILLLLLPELVASEEETIYCEVCLGIGRKNT
jgi:hypothetical protein